MKTVNVYTARPSTSVEAADALDFDLEWDGYTGTATLLQRQSDGRLAAWGEPSNWISRGLLSRLQALSDSEFRYTLDRIEMACVAFADLWSNRLSRGDKQ